MLRATRLPLTLAVALLAAAAVHTATLRQYGAQPESEHDLLLADVGEWEGTLTSYMTGEPMTMDAKQTVEAVGGFWTRTLFECDFMGQPYVGSGFTGYDPDKKKFVGTWVDSSRSSMALMEGENDSAKNAIVMRWDGPDMSGQIVPHRSETTRNKDGTVIMTFYTGEGESERKSMVIEMKRAAIATEAGTER